MTGMPEQQLGPPDHAMSASRTRELKRKLKRGPRLGRKELAAYMLGLTDANQPGASLWRPVVVPKLLLRLLEHIPEETIAAACEGIGHPLFWLGPGRRCECVCRAITHEERGPRE